MRLRRSARVRHRSDREARFGCAGRSAPAGCRLPVAPVAGSVPVGSIGGMAFRWWRRRRDTDTAGTTRAGSEQGADETRSDDAAGTDPSAAPVAPAAPTARDTLDPAALAASVDALVLPGFTSFDDVVEQVVEEHEDDTDDLDALRDTVEQVVRARWAARLLDQRDRPPGSGQYDRLREAFDILRQQGFVAAMATGVDQADGIAACEDARTSDGTAEDGSREWAYVFFHEQDAERLAETPTTLHLSYGAFRHAPDLEPDHVALAEQSLDGRSALRQHSRVSAAVAVVAALADHGLDATWSGDPSERIAVRVDRWQKPLPAAPSESSGQDGAVGA